MVSRLIFQLIVLLFSVIVHEVSHGAVAERLGDPTARQLGRLTLNPIKHLDPFGSFLLPALLFIASGGAFVFGWAKPVPYNPSNLKNPVSGAGKIAVAGPLSNLLLALIFGLIMRSLFAAGYVSTQLFTLFGVIIYINVLLAIFNLVPLPPLDGSKVLFALLGRHPAALDLINFLERYGLILLLVFAFFGFSLITPLVDFLARVIAGPGSQLVL